MRKNLPKLLVLGQVALLLAGCGGGDDPDPAPPVDTDRDGVADTSDCAPADAQAWRMMDFASRNDDGDGARINATGQICVGSGLPANRFADAVPANEQDCDDGDSNRWATRTHEAVDTDRDGFGVAGAGSLCTGSALPAGYLATLPATADLDCDDADADKWRLTAFAARDGDGDSYRVNATGAWCGQGTLPAHLFAQVVVPAQVDCDDADATRWVVTGIYRDADGDGVGAGTVLRQCLGVLPAGFVRGGYDPNDDPDDPAAAGVTELFIQSSLLTVVDDGDDEDIF
jgi:hypothetical protein